MRNVSKCYPNGSNALENVNIEIKKGEFGIAKKLLEKIIFFKNIKKI